MATSPCLRQDEPLEQGMPRYSQHELVSEQQIHSGELLETFLGYVEERYRLIHVAYEDFLGSPA